MTGFVLILPKDKIYRDIMQRKFSRAIIILISVLKYQVMRILLNHLLKYDNFSNNLKVYSFQTRDGPRNHATIIFTITVNDFQPLTIVAKVSAQFLDWPKATKGNY